MTEGEWLGSQYPLNMLSLVTDNPDHQDIVCCRSHRKLRLFACAARRLESRLQWYPGNGWTENEVDGQPYPGEPDEFEIALGDATVYLHSRRLWRRAAHRLRCVFGNPFRPAPAQKDWPRQVHDLAMSAYCYRTEDATLDRLTLLALADAMEEAGCPDTISERIDVHAGIERHKDIWKVVVSSARLTPVFPLEVFSASNRGDAIAWATQNLGTHQGRGTMLRAIPNPLLAHLRDGMEHVRGCHVIDYLLEKQ